MDGQLLTSITAGGGFAVGGGAAYFHLRRHAPWAPMTLRIATSAAIIVNAAYFFRSVGTFGPIETFRQNFESTVLLAALIGLVGVGTHLSNVLRGLDGFLFLLAAVIQFSALTVMGDARDQLSDRPWFISHPIAFAVSGACFVAGGAAGFAYLLINRVLRRKKASTIVGAAPPLEALERFGRWMLITGFPLYTFGVLTGICGVWHRDEQQALYKDPIVVSTFLTWLVYAYLFWSLLFRPQIRGRRAATLATWGMGLVVLMFLMSLVSPTHQ